MKTIKFSLLLTMLSFIYLPSYSQVVFGVRGGLNLSNMLIKDNSETYSSDYKLTIGGHIGGIVDFGISDAFSIESGLILTSKGFKNKTSGGGGFAPAYEAKATLTLVYLDIPITPKYKIDLGGPLLTLQLGPYIGVGLYGFSISRFEAGGSSETDSETVDWGDDGFKRLDYGLSGGAGLEINSIVMGIIYNYGLANISWYSDNGYKEQNRVLNITFGYRFNK